jgi:hypothetical protein
LTEVDFFCADFAGVRKAEKLHVTLRLPGTKYRNTYDIWVYPSKVKPDLSGKVLVSRSLDRDVLSVLEDGGRVVLLAKPEKLKKSVAMAFQSGFWSPMFRNKPGRLSPLGEETPGTQGILCDPKHPLFSEFPTEFHTNWQWWHLVKNSRAMVLDGTPVEFRPLVQVIDGFDRNHKLGLLFEAKVGRGRLLFCSIDLPALQSHPEARQFLSCIYRYAASAKFKPRLRLEMETIRELF